MNEPQEPGYAFGFISPTDRSAPDEVPRVGVQYEQVDAVDVLGLGIGSARDRLGISAGGDPHPFGEIPCSASRL